MHNQNVFILSSDSQLKWSFLKHELFLAALKIQSAKHITFIQTYNHYSVAEFLKNLNSETTLLVLDHTNINIQCVLSQIPRLAQKPNCYFYIDDLFIETALRFDVLPFNHFQNINGAFLYPTTPFQKFCQHFFPKAPSTVLSFPSFAQKGIFTTEERDAWRKSHGLMPHSVAITAPLALRRDSNVLYLLKGIVEQEEFVKNENLHLFLTLDKEEANVPFYLLSLPQGHLYQEFLQIIKSQTSQIQNRIHLIDNLSEEILWGSDLLIDISTTLPYTVRPECALAQECGTSILASSWGLCQKNLIEQNLTPLQTVPIRILKQGIELEANTFWNEFQAMVQNRPSWEQRLHWAKNQREKRKQNNLTTELMDTFKSPKVFGPTTWKLRYHSQNLKRQEFPLNLQSFEGHLYEHFSG